MSFKPEHFDEFDFDYTHHKAVRGDYMTPGEGAWIEIHSVQHEGLELFEILPDSYLEGCAEYILEHL